jgi:hypothetical protein
LICRFHVDNLSSAHVYLRLPRGESWEEVPEGVLEDCVQLVKANSIQGESPLRAHIYHNLSNIAYLCCPGCKLPNVPVIYTPHSNLKKTQGMDVGQVGFKNDKLAPLPPLLFACLYSYTRRLGSVHTQVKTVKVSKLSAILNRLNKTKVEKQTDLQGTPFLYQD